MTRLTRHDFLQLTSPAGSHCVSLYCPLERSGRTSPQDAIRMKNLMNEAENRLSRAGMRPATARDLIQQVRSRLDELDLWTWPGQTAAIFFSPENLFAYRLPTLAPESVTIGTRFRVRPLLDSLETEEPLYVLQLGGKNVGLYRVTEQKVEQMEVPNLPRDLEQTLNYDVNERAAQVHSADRALPGKQGAVFHGHGGVSDTAKQDLESFLRTVNRSITEFLRGDDTPLVLACVDYVGSIYRSVNTYPHLLPELIPGNATNQRGDELLQRVQPLRDARQLERKKMAEQRYIQHAGNHRSADNLSVILPAAAEGRVELLFQDPQSVITGSFEPTNSSLCLQNDPNADDLIELAAIETIRHRGQVCSLTGLALPTKSPIAAVMRY